MKLIKKSFLKLKKLKSNKFISLRTNELVKLEMRKRGKVNIGLSSTCDTITIRFVIRTTYTHLTIGNIVNLIGVGQSNLNRAG